MPNAGPLRKLPPLADQKSLHDRRKAQKLREREEAVARVEARQLAKKHALVSKAQPDQIFKSSQQNVAPPVRRAKIKLRHRVVFLSFVIGVLGTNLTAAWYLWDRAVDRYVSVAGFSVRTEQASSAIELLGGVAELSGSGTSDEDILYKFIQSQELVRSVDNMLDLRGMWSKANPDRDPIFSYHPPGSIEDLTEYWGDMVTVYSDSGTGIIDLEVQAFTPDDARQIARLIYDESSRMINKLSDIAREDATRNAREELETSVQRLKVARAEVSKFRNKNQIVSPDSTLQIQTGLLSSLETQMAETLIDLDLLAQTTTPNDPRVKHAERRREVIEERMHQERNKLGIGSDPGAQNSGFANIVGEFENLSVDRQFAEQSYTAALAAYDAAVADSRRQTRYLAAHISPTLAETSTYPNRPATMGLIALFSVLIWSILVMVGYSLKDRR